MFFFHFFCFCFSFALSLCIILPLTHSPTHPLTRSPPTIKLMWKVTAPSFNPVSLSLPKLPVTLPSDPCGACCLSHLSLRYLTLTSPPSFTASLPPPHPANLLHLLPPQSPLCFSDMLRVTGELPSVFHLPLSHLSHSLPADPPTQRVLGVHEGGLRTRSGAVSALLIGRPPGFCTAVEQQGTCLTAQDRGLSPSVCFSWAKLEVKSRGKK